MRFQNWLLMFWLSALFVGCSAMPRESSPFAATLQPLVTLTVHAVSSPPLASPRVSSTAQPLLPLVTLGPGQVAGLSGVRIAPPHCYDAPNDSLLCLGEVVNPFSAPLVNVQMLANLRDVDGSVMMSRRIMLEQTAVHPGQAAPYRVSFDNSGIASDGALVDVSLISSGSATLPPPLSITQDSGLYSLTANGYGRYDVSAQVSNSSDEPLSGLQAVVTIKDGADRVVGFRVIALDEWLAPGATLPLNATLIPLAADGSLRHDLTVNAIETD